MIRTFFLAATLVLTMTESATSAPGAIDERHWTVDGTDLTESGGKEPAMSVRPIPRTPVRNGLALSGRGTPFVVTPRIADLDGGLPTEAITLEAWVSIDMPTQWGGIIGAIQDNGEAETGVILGYGYETPYFGIAGEGLDDPDGRITYLMSPVPYTIGKWHHLVGTYDGTTMRLYQDGELVAESLDQSGPVRYSGDEPLAIGGYLDRNEDHGLDGRLREVSVLSDAISGREVRARFDRQAALAALPPEIDTTLAWMVEPFLVWPTIDAMSVVAETIAPSSMEVRVRDEVGTYRRTFRRDEPGRIHEFRIVGLKPNTKYFYEVVADAGESTLSGGEKTFRTAADRGDAFTFVAIGDTQSQPAVVKRVADLAFETRPSLVVHAGDLVTTGGDKGHWTNHFFPNMRPLIERVAIMPVLGNHEQDAKLYYDYMSLPAPERWYTFRYGDADFFMLDGNRSLADQSEQLEWLEGVLAASDAEWKFAILHQPPWTSDSNDYGDTFKEASKQGDLNARNIAGLLEKHGVDICFSGHVHDYERTFPLIDGDVVPWDEGGVIYVTTAGGGGHLEDFDPANTTFGHRKARRHHLVYCGIHHGILEFQAMDEDGRLFDVLTLDKRDGRRSVARAAREGVEIAPRTPSWRDAPAD